MPVASVDVPQDVLDEFEASLSTDIETWTAAVKSHSEDYEEGNDEDVDKANEEAKSVGLMIAYFLPEDTANQLAIEDGEEAEELHLTVLYLGKADQYTEDKIETIKKRIARFVGRYAPLQGEIGGQGRFPASPSSDALDVIIRLVDIPRLEAFREALIQELKSIQVEAILIHGYIPHITLAYVGPDYEGVCVHPEPLKIDITELTFSVGEDRFTYPLNGSVVIKAKGDAPNYRTSDSDKKCNNCAHASNGVCNLYKFKYKTGWVCDSWKSLSKRNDLDNEFPVAKLPQDLSITLSGEVIKTNKAKRLVFGWANIVSQDGKSVVDKQGDIISEDEMEKAAYKFTLTSRIAGEMHQKVGVGKLVESIAFTKEKQEALGINLGKTGWWVGFKISDEDVWKKIEKGEYKAFSIHGKGVREKVKD